MFTKTSTADETSATAKEETLGSFLKNARVNQGLNLTAISQATRINYNSLIALEENNRSALPADVFSRGFVKLYASHLKLDPHEALRLYDKQWDAKNPIIATFPHQNTSPSLAKPGIIISLLLIAAVLGIRLYYPGQANEPSSTLPPATTASSSSAVTPQPPLPLALSTDSENKKNATDKGDNAVPAATTTNDMPETSPPPYEIQLQSAQASTIKLVLDGQKTIEKTLQPGSKQIWQAEKAFELTVDGTSEITLTVNGTIIPIPSEAGQSATIHRP